MGPDKKMFMLCDFENALSWQSAFLAPLLFAGIKQHGQGPIQSLRINLFEIQSLTIWQLLTWLDR